MLTFKEYFKKESTDFMPLLRFYHAAEKGFNPDKEDAIESALILIEYYEEYLKWYDNVYDKTSYDMADKKVYAKIRNDYSDRLYNLRIAIHRNSLPLLITAVDNGINQWHIDFPAIKHLNMEFGDETDVFEKVMDILFRLERLPKKSPYIPVNEKIDLNPTQVAILRQSGIPHNEIEKYILDTMADGAELRRKAKEVEEGKTSIFRAAMAIAHDWFKKKNTKESSLKPEYVWST
jgi:hypothetical protein